MFNVGDIIQLKSDVGFDLVAIDPVFWKSDLTVFDIRISEGFFKFTQIWVKSDNTQSSSYIYKSELNYFKLIYPFKLTFEKNTVRLP